MNNYKLKLLLLISFVLTGSFLQAQPCGTVSLPSTIHACKGSTITLPATVSTTYPIYDIHWSPTTGLSSDTVLQPSATIGVASTSYSVTVRVLLPGEKIRNGAFNFGTDSFFIDTNPGYYFMIDPPGAGHSSDHDSLAVCTDPYDYDNSKFPIIGDHTTGTGNMLVVDGALDSTKSFWYETGLSVQPAKFYVITFWAYLFATPNPVVKMTINGNASTSTVRFNINGPATEWVQYTYLWPSGGNTTADIVLTDLTQSAIGNDFAIDDISMKELCELTPPSATATVLVSDFKPVESFIAKKCQTSVSFFGADSVNPKISYYTWNFGDGSVDTGSSVTHTYDSEGNYKVVFTAIDSFGCMDSSSTNVSVVTTSKDIKAYGDTTICKGATVQLSATGGISYSWAPTITLNDSASQSPTATPTQPTTYVVTAVDSQGCLGMDSARINFFPPPILHITPNTEPVTCSNSSIQLFVTGAKSFIWQPGLLCYNHMNTIPNPIVTPTTTTTFVVKGSDGKGCDAWDSITVICLRDTAYIPNAFTPNGDGHNDKIGPTPYCDFLFSSFTVFNRWGQQMFTTTKEGDWWDGKLSGQPQPQGVYMYIIKGFKIKEGQVQKIETVIKGNFTLLQ